MRRLSFASAVVLLLVSAGLMHANTITVTGHGDSLATDGVCTLREAVINANNNAATWTDCAAGSGGDVINLPSGTITLSINGRGEELAATGDIDVLDSVTINGDPAGTTLNAGGVDRFFDFNPAGFGNPPRPAITVALHNLTITGGVVQGDGGGFRVSATATVTADGITVTSCSSNNDGAGVKVETDGSLTMTNSTISGNHTALLIGGLRNDGTTTLTSCTVTNNSALAGRGNGLGGYGVATNLRNTIVAGNNGQPDG